MQKKCRSQIGCKTSCRRGNVQLAKLTRSHLIGQFAIALSVQYLAMLLGDIMGKLERLCQHKQSSHEFSVILRMCFYLSTSVFTALNVKNHHF